MSPNPGHSELSLIYSLTKSRLEAELYLPTCINLFNIYGNREAKDMFILSGKVCHITNRCSIKVLIVLIFFVKVFKKVYKSFSSTYIFNFFAAGGIFA